MPIRGQKSENKFFFKTNIILIHVSTCIFQGPLKNIVIRSVALVTKKLWAILDFFFHRPDFFPPCTLPYKLRKKCLNKTPSHFFTFNE